MIIKLFLILLTVSRYVNCDRLKIIDNDSIEIHELPEHEYSTRVGVALHIDCYDRDAPYDIIHCSIFDNNDKLVAEKCSHSILNVELENIGIWKCQASIKEKIYPMVRKIFINQIKDAVVQKYQEKDGYIQLSCHYQWKVNNKEIPNRQWIHPYNKIWCKALRPDHTQLTFSEKGSFEDDKYVTIVNNNQPQCELNIKLPLKPEEIGQWRLDVGISEYEFTGCFFTLPNNTILVHESNNHTSESIFNDQKSPIRLRGSAPWPIKHCKVQFKNEFLYQSLGWSAELMKHAGVCEIIIPIIEITEDFTGLWTMTMFSYEKHFKEVQIPIYIFGSNLRPDEKFIETKPGEIVNLIYRVPPSHSIANDINGQCKLFPVGDEINEPEKEMGMSYGRTYFSITLRAEQSAKFLCKCYVKRELDGIGRWEIASVYLDVNDKTLIKI